MKRELDLEIVDWIGRLGAASLDQVAARFAISQTWSHKHLAPLARDGLLSKHRILYRRPALYTATKSGLRWAGLHGFGVCQITARNFEHAWQMAEVAVAIAAGLPRWEVSSEREILWNEREHKELLASVRVGASSTRGDVGTFHRPDLALLSPQGRVAAIEVELTLKRRSSLVAICNGWARARHVDVVYYLTTPITAGPLRWAVKKTRAEDSVKILPLEQTAEVVWLEREAASAGGDNEHR